MEEEKKQPEEKKVIDKVTEEVDKSIKRIIEEGLSTGCINIQGSNEPSVMLEEMSGLNSYLSLFGSTLADKIQNKFKPKFIPGKDHSWYTWAQEVFDVYEYLKNKIN